MQIRRCPAAVKRLLGVVSQNARQTPNDEDRLLTLSNQDLSRPIKWAALGIIPLLLLGSPAFAHHPFGMGDSSQLTGWLGLLSGIGHPLLGPDHLLFLLAIVFIGLKRPMAWIIPMLAIGLGGSLISQFIPLPDVVAPWAEALVSLSLVVEGLIALSVAPAAWLLPLFALHGFLLGSTIVGAEPTPLITYFLGLLIGQGALLALVCSLSQTVITRLGEQGRRLGAGIWMGIGTVSYTHLTLPTNVAV